MWIQGIAPLSAAAWTGLLQPEQPWHDRCNWRWTTSIHGRLGAVRHRRSQYLADWIPARPICVADAGCSGYCVEGSTMDLRKTESVVVRDRDIFQQKLPLRSLFGSLWLWCSPINVSPDKAGLIVSYKTFSASSVHGPRPWWISGTTSCKSEDLAR